MTMQMTCYDVEWKKKDEKDTHEKVRGEQQQTTRDEVIATRNTVEWSSLL